MKKILLVTNLYPSKRRPEFGVFVQNIYNNLQSDNFKVDISRTLDTNFKTINYLSLLTSVVFNLVFKKYDIIYCHFSSHTFFVHFLVKLFNLKSTVITHLHGSDAVAEQGSLKYRLSNYSIRNSRFIICPSSAYKKYIIKNYNVLDNRFIIYPSGGVNDQFFEQGILKKEIKTFGYIGRIVTQKGVFTLVRAFKDLVNETKRNDLELVFSGNGNDLDKLKNFIKTEGICNVKFIEPTKYIMLSKFFNNIDCLVFPTEYRFESLGLVGLEAFTFRTLLIGSNALGPSSYMTDENSLIFELGNETELKNKMLEVLSKGYEERHEMISNAYSTALEYKSSKVSNEFSKVLRNL